MTIGYVLKPRIARYTQWRKALWTDPELRERFAKSDQKYDARQVAEVIALDGINGRKCFPSADRVAELVGCHRNLIQTQRQWLIQQGWFAEVDRKGRAIVLDIALPVGVALELQCGARSWSGRRSAAPF